MTLGRLEVHHLRNIAAAQIQIGSRFNVFIGSNGAGKTSVLEAVHLLGRGTSFRSGDLSQLVNHTVTSCAVSGYLRDTTFLGVEYGLSGFRARVNGTRNVSRAELAEYLPIIFMGPDSHRLLTEGPPQRRRLLDWGVFHVEPGFITIWRRCQRALRQRNEALKNRHPVNAWNQGLVETAYQLDHYRRCYIERLIPFAQHYVHELLERHDLQLDYVCGWRFGMAYDEVLQRALEQDQKLGHTRFGPHRADIQIKFANRVARDVVSRGQQKLLVFGLLLAQAALFNSLHSSRCMVLVDDLTSELDLAHRTKLLSLLKGLDTQVLITAVDDPQPSLLTDPETVMFHVEQGKISRLD